MNEDEFNWYDEDEEPIPEATETPPPYTENVIMPQKQKKSKVWLVSLVAALITGILFSTAFYMYIPYMKAAIIKELKTDAGYNVKSNESGKVADIPSISGKVLSTEEIAKVVSPSVVGILNIGNQTGGFLNVEREQGSGSGIIIDEKGFILTNNHVVANSTQLKVVLSTGEEYEAKLIGTDAQTDIAILKIEAKNLRPAVLGNSSELQIGETAIAIGNPLGQQLAGSITQGVISSLNRKLSVENATYNFIQTDAAINAGNSGGALVNKYGKVIGINSVKISGSGVEGLSFAIPIDDAKPIIEDLMTSGYVKGRPSIGVDIAEINNMLAYYYDLPLNYGLYVNSVLEYSAAEKAGIKRGDIIIKFNDEDVRTVSELNEKRDKFKAGDTVKITVHRNGRDMVLDVTLGENKPIATDNKTGGSNPPVIEDGTNSQ